MPRKRESKGDIFNFEEPLAIFGGLGSQRSMFPSLFGGRDPFEDPFFSRPFSGSLFQSHVFSPSAAPGHNYTVETGGEKDIVIEELGSDYEDEQEDRGSASGDDDKVYSRKYSKEPTVEHPDDVADERKSNNVTSQNEPSKVKMEELQNRSYSFQTSKVTYGGVDGAYFTSSRTRRGGGDGVMVEETKEADKTTGQATHKISRGIHDKGHSVTRMLNTDGNVDTLQTLHNLMKELAGFEDMWNSKHLPGWKGSSDTHDFAGSSSRKHRGGSGSTWGSWLLPASERAERTRETRPDNEARTSGGTRKNVVRINIE